MDNFKSQDRHMFGSRDIDRRKLLKRGAALGVGMSALGGSSRTSAQEEPTEISFTTDWTSGARGDIVAAGVAEFQTQFPQYKVKVVGVGGTEEFKDKLAVDLAGGTASDVILFHGGLFLNFQGNGAFADITPHLETLGVDLSAYTSVPNVFQVGDQQFGMPFQLTITTWYANIDMFEAAGIALPTEGWDWDDLLEIATALTLPDQEQWGVWMQNENESAWGPLMLSAGGNWMNEDKTKTAFADGNGFDGFKFAVDLIHEHQVSPTPAQTTALSAATDDMFISGRVAMAPANSSAVGRYMREVGDAFRWQPIPQPAYPATGVVRTTYNDQPHVVNAQANDIVGATQLAVFMSGEFVQGLIADGRGSTPVLRSLQETERYLSSPPPNMEQILKNLAFAEDLGYTRNFLEWDRAVVQAADLAFIGESSAEEAFENAIAGGDAVLAQG